MFEMTFLDVSGLQVGVLYLIYPLDLNIMVSKTNTF